MQLVEETGITSGKNAGHPNHVLQEDKVDRMEVGCRWYVFYNDKFIRVWLLLYHVFDFADIYILKVVLILS